MSDILPELNGKEYYKNIEDNYNIHFCSIGEVDKLVDFLKKYWRENHIFVLSRKLLDWQHLDEGNNRYNFVVAKEKFNPVTMEEVIAYYNESYELPDNAVLLTFDDGYIDHYTNVFPILNENGIQGSFFIPGKTFR